MLMKDKFLSKAYGGWREASDKLKGLGLPGKWKVITSTLFLLFTLGIGQMWGQDVTLADINYTQWDGTAMPANSGLSNSNTYYASNGTSRVATLVGKGCKLDDSSNQPTATGVSGSYEHYLRFGSSGNYLNITASNDLVKNAGETSYGKVRFLVSSQKNKTTDELAEVKIGETSLGKIYAFTSTSTCDWVEFDIPATVSKNATITLTRTTNTLFVWGIQIKTFTSSSSPVSVTGITLAPSSATIKVGKTVTLVPTIAPSDATDKAVTWAVTSGSSYASVTDAGVVTGLAAGTAVVTATAHDGSGVTQTATITVEDCPTSGTLFSMTVTDPDGTVYTDVTNAAPQLIGATYVGGKAYATSTSTSKRSPKITGDEFDFNVSSSSSVAVKVELDCPLAEGDMISFTSTHTKEFKIQKVAGTALHQTSSLSLAIPSESALIGEDVFYVLCANSACSFSVITVTRPIVRTITLEYADGTTPDGSIDVVDGTAAVKPADPTWAKHRFDGWYNGANPYDWTATVSSDLTLTAHWTQLYSISFEAGEGSGDAPAAIADKAQGETFQVPANTYTAPGTKVFAAWNDGANDYAPGYTYTVGTADVVLTAQWVANDYEAKIGTTMYATFAEALTHATDGEIVLLKNVNVTAQIDIAAGVTATIDLAGYKIEYTGSETLTSGVIMVHNGASLTINDSSDPDAGSIVAGTKAYAAIALTKAGDDAANPAILVVNGGIFTGYYYAITGHGARHNTQITINGGAINATASGDNQGIYHPQNGTLTINGGTITAYSAAVEMRAGELEINGGTFTATATEFSCNPNGNGTTTVGAAIAIAQHTTKKDITVTINGGEFNGVKAINESNPQVNDPAPQVAMAITDGEFNGAVETVDVNHFISGGTFDAPVAAANCAENYAPKDNGDGTYGVKPLATTFDIEAYVVSTAEPTIQQVRDSLTAVGYTYSNIANVDRGHSHNYIYDGIKWSNANDGYIQFETLAGKLVIVKTGRMQSNASAKMSINGVEDATVIESPDEATETHKQYYWYNAAAALYKLDIKSKNTNGTCVLKAITITDPYVVSFDPNGGEAVAPQTFYGTALTLPSAVNGTSSLVGWFDAAEGGNKIGDEGDSYIPTADITLYAQWEAVSTDARLASITFSSDAGTLSPAFDPEVVNYTYTMPYGTAAIPTITGATSVNAKAQDPIIGEAAAAWGDAQTIKGVAQSGDKKTYTITMAKAPKDGVVIIHADIPSGTSADYAATGLYAGTGNSKNEGSSLKLGTNHYAGVNLSGSEIFKEGDILNIHVKTKNGFVKAPISTTNAVDGSGVIFTEERSFVVGDNFITLTSAFEDAKSSSLYLVRTTAVDAECNPAVDYIEVTRAMDPVLKSITFNSTDVAVSSTSVSATLPYGTNLGTMTVTPEIIWNGAAAENSILINGSATGAWVEGENTYKLTDKDGDATTYTITLSIADHYEAQISTTGYATLVAAVAAAQADDVVQLLDNVDLMATGLAIAENITLDLNGFNIKAGEQIDNDILVPAGKKLTLVDNSANAEGKIYTEQAYTGAVTGYGLVRVAGELLMQSGNIYAVIESNPADLGQFAVVIAAGGKVTVEGGQIKAGWYAISNNGLNSGSTIIVSGGELISTADYAIYNPSANSTVTVSGGVVYGAAGGIAMNRGELTVTGGTITSKDQGTTGTWGDGTGGLSNAAISASGKYESVEVEISGGTIIAEGTAVMITNGTTNPVEVAISGGQFSHVVPAEYCAKDYVPVTTPNTDGKFVVQPAGVIRAAAAQDTNHGNAYAVTLDNGVVVISSNSDGKFDTNNQFDNSAADAAVALGADEGKYRYKGQHMLLKFPVNVNEFTIYSYDNNTTDRKINKVTVGDDPVNVKLKNNDAIGTYTFTNNTTTKLRTMTATMTDDEIIASDKYVYVGLSNAHTVFRILFTEAPCVDPVINSTNATRVKVTETATVSVDATALGATYQWYRCDNAAGDNAVIIAGATAASYSFTKAAGDEYFKVVVGNNCNDVKVEAVVKAEVWTKLELADVTGNTTWSWAGVADGEVKINDVANKGLVLANYIDAPNFDKLEGHENARAYRNNDYPAYQGTSLKFHTTVAGAVIMDVRTGSGSFDLSVNGTVVGEITTTRSIQAMYVGAGDVLISATDGEFRIYNMEFKLDNDDEPARTDEWLAPGELGTICIPQGAVAVGADIYELVGKEPQYGKIVFETVEHMKPGKPYLFQSKGTRIDFILTDETPATAPDNSGAMKGTFVDLNLTELENVYYFAQHALWSCSDLTSLSVPANRAYVKLDEVEPLQTPNPAPGRRRVVLGVHGQNVVTGMDELNASEAPVKMIIDGKLYILRGEKMFDATGRLVK